MPALKFSVPVLRWSENFCLMVRETFFAVQMEDIIERSCFYDYIVRDLR